MAKKMLIDATHLEETRVVVADGNKVEEFDFESINKRQLAGNIYLAKVTRVEPSLQAAFVDYGGNRHGFLAFSEIHPDYYQIPVADREALLAEEAAEQARSADREDQAEGEDKSKSRSRRGKRRTRGKPSETPNGNGEVAGLEVIELGNEGSDGDDTAAADGDTPREVKGLEIADLTEGEAEDGGAETPDPEVAETDAEDSEETETTPKSMAESAGLEDDDSVSEDILDAAPKPSEDKKAPKARVRRNRKKTQPAPEADTPTEGDGAGEVTAEAAPERADTAAAEETTAGSDTAETKDRPAAKEPKSSTRSRKRRSRAKDEGESEVDDTDVEPA